MPNVEGEDCPVSDKLCESRMATLHTEIDGLKTTVKVTGTVITIILAAVEVVLRFL